MLPNDLPWKNHYENYGGGEKGGRGEIYKGTNTEVKFTVTFLKVLKNWEFPGGPVVRTPSFHCRGYGFDPWSGN